MFLFCSLLQTSHVYLYFSAFVFGETESKVCELSDSFRLTFSVRLYVLRVFNCSNCNCGNKLRCSKCSVNHSKNSWVHTYINDFIVVRILTISMSGQRTKGNPIERSFPSMDVTSMLQMLKSTSSVLDNNQFFYFV